MKVFAYEAMCWGAVAPTPTAFTFTASGCEACPRIHAGIAAKLAVPLTRRAHPLPPYTDMDHHPYTRFFRGVYDNPRPVVHSRHAGVRSVADVLRVR